MNVIKQQYNLAAHQSFLIHTGALASCQAATAPLSQYVESIYTMCLRIHLPVMSVFIDNFHGRQGVALAV